MKRRQISAAEKKRMDAILNTLGPPPEWFSDPIDDDEIVDAEVELQSPDGVTMHRPMPGSSESRMSVGVPDPAERATSDARTTSRAGKKKTIACRKGVRVVVKRKLMKNSIAVNSKAWDVIKDLSDDTQLYGTCTTSSAKGCFTIKFDRLPFDDNLVSVSRRHLRPLAKDEDEPEFSHQMAQEQIDADEEGIIQSECESGDEGMDGRADSSVP
jgi:hypothetical protein